CIQSFCYSYLPIFFFFTTLPPPPTSTLFPYTTLFRSKAAWIISFAPLGIGLLKRIRPGRKQITNARFNSKFRNCGFEIRLRHCSLSVVSRTLERAVKKATAEKAG